MRAAGWGATASAGAVAAALLAAAQAGTWADGVTYAQHTEAGSAPTAPGTVSWTVEWRSPAAGTHAARAVPVVFHAAANAANDDASEFGDFIYTASATTRPAGP